MTSVLRAGAVEFRPSAYAPPFSPKALGSVPKNVLNSNAKSFIPNASAPTFVPTTVNQVSSAGSQVSAINQSGQTGRSFKPSFSRKPPAVHANAKPFVPRSHINVPRSQSNSIPIPTTKFPTFVPRSQLSQTSQTQVPKIPSSKLSNQPLLPQSQSRPLLDNQRPQIQLPPLPPQQVPPQLSSSFSSQLPTNQPLLPQSQSHPPQDNQQSKSDSNQASVSVENEKNSQSHFASQIQTTEQNKKTVQIRKSDDGGRSFYDSVVNKREDKPSRYEREDKSSRYEREDKSRYEREDKSSRYEREDKSSRYEREDKPSRYEREDKSSGYDRTLQIDDESEKENIPSQMESFEAKIRPLFTIQSKRRAGGMVLGPGAIGTTRIKRPPPMKKSMPPVISPAAVIQEVPETEEKSPVEKENTDDSSSKSIQLRAMYKNKKQKNSNSIKKEEKVYSVEFMMRFQKLEHCTLKPNNLPDPQELTGNNTGVDRNRRGAREGANKWRGDNRRQQQRTPTNRQQRTPRGRQQRRKEEELLPPVEPLKKSENRYKATRKEDLTDQKKVIRGINSILNKLTPEKFETLVKRFQDEIPITDLGILKSVVNCVFEKALSEPNFCPTYAKFCNTINSIPSKHEDFKEGGQVQTFKRLLLNQCQQEFEGHSKLPPNADQNIRDTKKKRLLGTIKFIGELYIRKMATGRIIKECLRTLMIKSEEDLEALCRLLETCGKQIDGLEPKLLTPYFQKLNEWFKDNTIKLSMRIKFKIKDVIELRQKKWIARIKKEEAKKISEIHNQDKKEKLMAQKQAAKAASRSRNNRGPRGNNVDRYSSMKVPNKKSRSTISRFDEDWQTSQRKKPNSDPRRTRVNEDSRQSRNYKKKDVSQKRAKNNESRDGGSQRNAYSLLGTTDDEEERDLTPRSRPSGLPRSRRQEQSTPRSTTRRDGGHHEQSTRRPESQEIGELITPSRIDEDENDEKKKKIIKDIEMLYKELFMCHDLENAFMCVEDLKWKEYNYLLFSLGIKCASDFGKAANTALVIKLLEKLAEKKIVSPSLMTRGLVVLLDEIINFSIDSPKVWEIAGEVMAAMSIDKMVSLTHFSTMKDKIPKIYKIIVHSLKNIKKKHGLQKMKSMFKESGIIPADFLTPQKRQDINKFLERHDLKELN